MWGMAAAAAGLVAAVGCCAAPTRWRARALAVLMALTCLPVLPDLARIAGAAGLIVAALALAVGSRRLPVAEGAADLHRAIGGALMAGMLLAGGHGAGAAIGAHAHGGGASPHLLFALASLAYLAWTARAALRLRHPGADRAARAELAAMGAMFVLLLAGMVVG